MAGSTPPARAMATINDPAFLTRIHIPDPAGRRRLGSRWSRRRRWRRLAGGACARRLLHVLDGARHEVLMERDRLREQYWAAFDAFVPGTDRLA